MRIHGAIGEVIEECRASDSIPSHGHECLSLSEGDIISSICMDQKTLLII